MATDVQPLPTRTHAPEERFLLHGVSWETYMALGTDLERAHSKIRINYDNGLMELVMNSREHEKYSRALCGLMDVLGLELEIVVDPGGSTTHTRADLKKGFEPDECFYIRNEPLMRGKKTLDLTTDPPPDLTFEVEMTRGAIPRMPLFAAIGVPEVWRFDGEQIMVHVLQEDKTYAVSETSLNFPWLPMAAMARFVKMAGDEETDRLQWLRAFRDWVRLDVVPRARAEEGGGQA